MGYEGKDPHCPAKERELTMNREKIKVAVFQSSSTPVPEENLKKAEAAVKEAAES